MEEIPHELTVTDFSRDEYHIINLAIFVALLYTNSLTGNIT